MPADEAPLAALGATDWVHAFEEDGAAGAVFRPADADLPLSRRPRARLAFAPDGTASLYEPAPDDRPRPRAARWAVVGGAVEVRTTDDGPARTVRILEWSADRLLVHADDVS